MAEPAPNDPAHRAQTKVHAELVTDERVDRAVDALMADSGVPRFGPHRAEVERRQRIAFAAAFSAEPAQLSATAVRAWLRGLGRNIIHDLGDTTCDVRATEHPHALAQEFDRWLATHAVAPSTSQSREENPR